MPSPSKKKKPSDHQQKSVRYGSSWKTMLFDLELPSGEMCQVKRPGVQGLLKAGVLHSMDALTAIVQQDTIPTAEGKPKVDVQKIMDDPEKFNTMMETVDKIVIHVVTEPKLVTPAITQAMVDDPETAFTAADLGRELEPEERDPELVYIDYVDMMDRMFIMNFAVGGSADLVQFRKETADVVGSVPAVEAAEHATE
jgi:hypothetical protein